MVDRTALMSLIVTRAAIAGGRRDLPLPQNRGDEGTGGEGAGGGRGAVIHACDDVRDS